MAENIQKLNDDDLDQVSGGLLDFNGDVLTYFRGDSGTTHTFRILNYDAAWQMSNDLHAKSYHEDYIIGQMMQAGYIA